MRVHLRWIVYGLWAAYTPKSLTDTVVYLNALELRSIVLFSFDAKNAKARKRCVCGLLISFDETAVDPEGLEPLLSFVIIQCFTKSAMCKLMYYS